MESFRDTAGRTWQLSLTPDLVAAVRTRTGVDLVPSTPAAMVRNDFLRIANDIAQLVGILYILLESQILAAGLSPEAFAQSLGVAGYQRAVQALIHESQSRVRIPHHVRRRYNPSR